MSYQSGSSKSTINYGSMGNLNINTNKLEYKDIKDFNKKSDKGFGISVGNVSINGDENGPFSYGKSIISLKHLGHRKEQKTRATAGAGNIVIGGVIQEDNSPLFAGLNRDSMHSQVLTKDKVTGALDATFVIDNRWFMPSKRHEVNPRAIYESEQAVVDRYFENKEQDDRDLTLFPPLWTKGPALMGRETYSAKDGTLTEDFTTKYGKGTTPNDLTFGQKLISPFDINPMFGLFYNLISGASSATLYHDAGLSEEKDPMALASTIPGYFINTYYGMIYKSFVPSGGKK